MIQFDTTFIAIVSALISVIAAFISWSTYQLNRKLQPLAPASRLMDRLYEIDKLILQYPGMMNAFLEKAERNEPYFYAPKENIIRDTQYIQLKAFSYYWLNYLQEIYLVLQDKSVSDQVEGQVWLDWIIQKMRHPLLREVFDHEAEQIYKGKFVDFVRSKSEEIKHSRDGEIFW